MLRTTRTPSSDLRFRVSNRRPEMNGEVVDTSKNGQASPRVRLGTDHRDTRRGITVISPRAMDAVGVCEGERQKLLRPRRQRDNEWDGADPPSRHAVRSNVRPQHRTRWGHFRLEHLSKPPRSVYRVSASHAG